MGVRLIFIITLIIIQDESSIKQELLIPIASDDKTGNCLISDSYINGINIAV